MPMMKRFCNRQRCLPFASGVAAPAGRHAASPPPRVSTRTHGAFGPSVSLLKRVFYSNDFFPPTTPPVFVEQMLGARAGVCLREAGGVAAEAARVCFKAHRGGSGGEAIATAATVLIEGPLISESKTVCGHSPLLHLLSCHHPPILQHTHAQPGPLE